MFGRRGRRRRPPSFSVVLLCCQPEGKLVVQYSVELLIKSSVLVLVLVLVLVRLEASTLGAPTN